MSNTPTPGEPQVVRNSLQSPPTNDFKDMACRLPTEPHHAQPDCEMMSTESNVKECGTLIEEVEDLAITRVGTYSPSSQNIQDCITVAPRHTTAQMARGSHFAAFQPNEDGPKYDLTALSNPIQATSKPSAPMYNLEQVYNVLNSTPWGNQRSDSVQGQNTVQHRQSNMKTTQPRASKLTKRNPLGPRYGSGISKPSHRPKQPAKQQKRSRNPQGNGSNIATAKGGNSTPSSRSDPTPYYQVAQAPNLSRLIPQFDPALVSTCPKPPQPSEMLDGEKYFLHQMAIARHLAFNGVSGPYQVGHCLCDVHKATGSLIKFARACTAPNGENYWHHIMTGASIKAQDGSSMTGKPVALSNGALVWMADENGKAIPPEWTFKEPHFSSGPPSEDQGMRQHPVRTQQDTNPIHPGLKTGHDPFWW
ncbi:hypothetical protein FBEOM_9942 [Fusarium beomiforme]|uniref:Uncharacterized protein n=1 Tax=Fusarium beomiforme TaxID=44412 RepID=A0A9P5ACF2_9HYPO|nr:hypothetical protein FBEOM_9942 [Fusarium beomiforme]